MTQEEFAQALETWKKELLNETVVHYQHGDAQRGYQEFGRWKERFIDFLRKYTPDEAERFKEQTHHMMALVIQDEHPYTQFMREDGKTCIAFIDSLSASARKGRVLNFQEIPSVPQRHLSAASVYVSPNRIRELQAINSQQFDLSKLIRLCEELNSCFASECYLAVAMLVRTVVDHIPPIFGCNNFTEIANNYAGTKSFKASMQHLDASSRKIADGHLHSQIRRKETLPNETQVAFYTDLDLLLAEVVRILK